MLRMWISKIEQWTYRGEYTRQACHRALDLALLLSRRYRLRTRRISLFGPRPLLSSAVDRWPRSRQEVPLGELRAWIYSLFRSSCVRWLGPRLVNCGDHYYWDCHVIWNLEQLSQYNTKTKWFSRHRRLTNAVCWCKSQTQAARDEERKKK